MSAQRAGDGGLLLTGATGFLGMELLARYLQRTERHVLAPVRARDDDEADARIASVLELLFGRADTYRDRVTALCGDVQRDELGLAPASRDRIASTVTEIVHCAATVSFTAGLSESRKINVDGTRNVLALAALCSQRGELRHFSHISTAYVAGTHPGQFTEHDLDVGQRFRNPYERSKFEAEQLVRAHAAKLPATTIVRPSIIVGESTTGWTPAFNVIYVPLRAFAQRRLKVLPATMSAPVDVVPVDHVADAILELAGGHTAGLNTYHVVAAERAATVKQLVELSARQLRRPPPPIVPPRLYRAGYPLLLACSGRRRRAAVRRAKPFLPYYTMSVRYTRDHAAARLDPAGLQPPALESYYARLLDYALASSWGRRTLPRPRAITELGYSMR
jgi:long-chain acyl-CoA synthetase